MPSKQKIATHWENGVASTRGDVALHCDDGEPMCWACGAYSTDHDGKRDAYDHASWLERAHLVAHAAGGSVEPDNLVLLCHQCHRDMDRELGANTDRDRAIEWVRGWRGRFFATVEGALSDARRLIPKWDDETFMPWLDRLGELDFDSRSPSAVAHAAVRAAAEVSIA